MEASQRARNTTAIRSNNSTLMYTAKKTEISMSKRHLHSRIYCSPTGKSQGVETMQEPIS